MSKRGRPPLSRDEPSTSVGGLKLTASMYDRAYERAREERISVPEVIRRALQRDLERQNSQS